MKCFIRFMFMHNLCKRLFFEYADKMFTEGHSNISNFFWPNRSSHQRCSVKKVFWKIPQILQEDACVGVFLTKLQAWALQLLKARHLRFATLFKTGTLAQAFSCEFWEIFKNIFFIEHLRWLLLKTTAPSKN